LRAIRAGRCRERRYADHIFIQIFFRMHHFLVKFSKKNRLRQQGGIDPLPKILRTFLLETGRRSRTRPFLLSIRPIVQQSNPSVGPTKFGGKLTRVCASARQNGLYRLLQKDVNVIINRKKITATGCTCNIYKLRTARIFCITCTFSQSSVLQIYV